MRASSFDEAPDDLEPLYRKLDPLLSTILSELEALESTDKEPVCFSVLQNLVMFLDISNPQKIAMLEIIKHGIVKEYEE
tara:strand:+ start:351 stop:587 length:237 start_codon:yes stop_codon:yes gene_type:complete